MARVSACRSFAAALLIASASAVEAQTALPDDLRVAGDRFIAAVKAHDLAAMEARFDVHMRAALPHDKFVAVMKAIEVQVGSLKTCAAPVSRKQALVTVVEYRCEFDAAPVNLRLAWTEQGEMTGLFFLPIAAAAAEEPLPAGVRSEAVTTGAAGWPLPGTLLMPASTRPVPMVLLVHGSGPNDRDETVGANKPFRDLALALASRGIGSLRYEKRTRALGDRFAAELKDWTLDDEIVDDAVAALAQLANRKDVGPLFLVGHSEGALLAPRIAAAAAARRGVTLAGIVMLAAPVTPLADLLVDQYVFLSRLPTPTVTAAMLEDVRQRRDNVRLLLEGKGDGLPLPLDMPASAWRDIARYDPAATLLAQPGLPALLIFGGRDFQVPIREKALWERRIGSRPLTRIVEEPTISHLLIEGAGPMSPVEYDKPGHVSGDVIEQVAGWIIETANR